MVNYQNMQHNAAIAGLLNRVVLDTPIDRALLLVARNGGEYKYGSVMLEIDSNNVPEIKGDFKDYPLDRQYINMLNDLKEKGALVIATEQISDGSYLKRRYTVDGIKGTYLFFLAEVKNTGFWHRIVKLFSKRYLYKRIYYLSFTSISDAMFAREVVTSLEAKANNVKNLLEKVISMGDDKY